MRTLATLFCLTLFSFVAGETYVYEFGNDEGFTIFAETGYLGLLEYKKTINIAVPVGVRVSYVKVVIGALAPPKVDFDSNINQVKITYSLLEITASTYSISVKGVASAMQQIQGVSVP